MIYIKVTEDRPDIGWTGSQTLHFLNVPTLEKALEYACSVAEKRSKFPDHDYHDCIAVRGLDLLKKSGGELVWPCYTTVKDANHDDEGRVEFTISMGRVAVCEW